MQYITSPNHSIRRPDRVTFGQARRATTGAIGAALVLGLVASACGEAVEASAPWCEAMIELDSTLASVGEPDPDTVRAVFTGLDEAGTTIADRAPRSVRSAAETVERAIDDGASSGEPTLFDPTVSAAFAEVHAYAAEECAYEQVSVVATDYAFVGLPEIIPAGKVALAFDNESGREAHELVLFVKAEGVDLPMAELLALPEEEAMTMARPAGFTMADPNGRSGLILDLEPGNYAAVCFVPVGGTDDGAPHFVHGMIADFVVG